MFGIASRLFGGMPYLFRSKTGRLCTASDPFSDLPQAFVRLSSALSGVALLLGDLAPLLCGLAMPLAAFPLMFVSTAIARTRRGGIDRTRSEAIGVDTGRQFWPHQYYFPIATRRKQNAGCSELITVERRAVR
jgi:hypothetical protein